MATINVKDAGGSTVAVEKPLTPGRAAAASSRPVALSTEDLAAIDGLEGLLTTISGQLTTIDGRVDGLEGLIGTSNTTLTAIDGRVDGLEGAIGTATDATVASGAAGTLDSHLRTIKDAVLDTTTTSPVSVRQPCDVITFTPTLDTAIYASGDTLFVATALSGVTRANDERALLQSIAVIDKDDQKPALRLVFFSASVAFGTLNAAPSISDADAANYLGHVDIAAADYVDLGGVSVACAKGINLLLESVSGATSVYIAAMLTAGTPTHTASGLVFRLGVVHS